MLVAFLVWLIILLNNEEFAPHAQQIGDSWIKDASSYVEMEQKTLIIQRHVTMGMTRMEMDVPQAAKLNHLGIVLIFQVRAGGLLFVETEFSKSQKNLVMMKIIILETVAQIVNLKKDLFVMNKLALLFVETE